jgi:Fe2+ or Zn2+ uptake regulation protein
MFDSIQEKLRKNKIKMTPKRLAILEHLEKEGKCVTPERVWEYLRKKFAHCGLPSIYRNLELFEKYGILVRIYLSDRKSYYALCHDHEGEHHHHIVCVDCGRVDDLPICNFPKIKSINGFKILGHMTQVEGLCPGCQR